MSGAEGLAGPSVHVLLATEQHIFSLHDSSCAKDGSLRLLALAVNGVARSDATGLLQPAQPQASLLLHEEDGSWLADLSFSPFRICETKETTMCLLCFAVEPSGTLLAWCASQPFACHER